MSDTMAKLMAAAKAATMEAAASSTEFWTSIGPKLSKDNCYGTGVGADMCDRYVNECLSGSGSGQAQCNEFFSSQAFWDSVSDVPNMDPEVAKLTLKRFGFAPGQSVDDWAKTALTGEAANLVTNDKLVSYLKACVARAGAPGAGDDAWHHPLAAAYEIPARVVTPKVSVASIDRITSAVQVIHQRIAMALGLSGLFSGILVGGGGVYKGESTPMLAGAFDRMLKGFKATLNAHGKSIQGADETKINDLISELREKEHKLHTVMVLARKYSELLDSGVNDPVNKISAEYLNKFVEAHKKYFQKVSSRQMDLLSILRTLAEAAGKESS